MQQQQQRPARTSRRHATRGLHPPHATASHVAIANVLLAGTPVLGTSIRSAAGRAQYDPILASLSWSPSTHMVTCVHRDHPAPRYDGWPLDGWYPCAGACCRCVAADGRLTPSRPPRSGAYRALPTLPCNVHARITVPTNTCMRTMRTPVRAVTFGIFAVGDRNSKSVEFHNFSQKKSQVYG